MSSSDKLIGSATVVVKGAELECCSLLPLSSQV